MKAWGWTYVLFLRHLAKLALIMAGVSCLLIFLSRELLSSVIPLSQMRGFFIFASSVIFFLYCTIAANLPSRNLSWLQVLPMSKRQLIFFFFVIQVTAILFATLAAGTVALTAAWSLSGDGLGKVIEAVIDAVGHFPARIFFDEWAKRITLTQIAVGVTMLNGFLWYAFRAPVWQGLLRSMQTPLANRPEQAMRATAKQLAMVLAIFLGAALFLDYVTSGFGCASLIGTLFMVLLPLSWASALSLGRPLAKKGFALCLTFAAVQVLWIYSLALRQTTSSDSDRRAQSILFLGPFAGNVAPREIARLIEEGDRGWESLQSLGKRYARDSKLDARHSDLNLVRAVASKKSMDSAASVYALFAPETVGLADLSGFLSAISKLRPRFYDENFSRYPIYQFVRAALTPDEVIGLFASESEIENLYALARARYDRRAEYLPAIISNLPRFSDRATMTALGTLAILTGRPFTLKDLPALATKRLVPAFYNPDCSGFHKVDIADFQGDEALWNVCTRTVADPTNRPQDLAYFESVAWHTRQPK